MNDSQTISTKLKTIIVQCADEEILPRFQRVRISVKTDGSLVTDADFATQERLKTALQELCPEVGFVGEEMSAEEQQRRFNEAADGVWILDPLDGTRNFAAGIAYFSVSLALIKKDEVALGLVYDPVRREMFSAVKGEGTQLNGQVLKARPFPWPLQKCIGLIDFKRLPKDLAGRLAQHPPYASQRSFGSVALDWCWIAAGRGHIYLHGNQKLWDYAAGWLILQEAGGYSCSLDGELVFTGELESRSAVAATDKNLFEDWCRWLAVELHVK
jgi:myo-inositol-1(or 4)-monophosphatase